MFLQGANERGLELGGGSGLGAGRQAVKPRVRGLAVQQVQQ